MNFRIVGELRREAWLHWGNFGSGTLGWELTTRYGNVEHSLHRYWKASSLLWVPKFQVCLYPITHYNVNLYTKRDKLFWSWWTVYWVTVTRSSKSQVWFHTERKSKRNVNLWNLGRKWTLIRLEWLTIYMGKPEILVGKSNGLRHFVWGASENMGGDLRRCNFPILFSLFGRCLFFYLDIPCSWSFSHHIK